MATPTAYSNAARRAHEATCDFHTAIGDRCHAITNSHTRCTYTARIFVEGRLPVCGRHRNKDIRAATCQTLELCGKPCSRPVPTFPANTACDKHKNGITPCYLLQLPVEVRMMIFRYLFPQEIPSWGRYSECDSVKVAILKLNRQIYEEASSVLYDESEFQAIIRNGTIQYLGETCYQGLTEPRPAPSLPSFARRVQRLRVVLYITLDYWDMLSTLQPGEYTIYSSRMVVQQFVDALKASYETNGGDSRHLTRLAVQPKIERADTWTAAEAITTLFLTMEPFTHLKVRSAAMDEVFTPDAGTTMHSTPSWKASNIDESQVSHLYKAHQKHWTTSMTAAVASEGCVEHPDAVTVQLVHKRIENTIRAISDFNPGWGPEHSRLNRVFDDDEDSFRPWHLLRTAVENVDLPVLNHMREVIMKRWDSARKCHLNAINDLSKTFSALYDMGEDSAAPQPVQSVLDMSNQPPHDWSDLEMTDSAPKVSDEGVDFDEDLLRVRIRKDGQEWVRLKTPAVMQIIRGLKEA